MFLKQNESVWTVHQLLASVYWIWYYVQFFFFFFPTQDMVQLQEFKLFRVNEIIAELCAHF